MAEHKLTKKEYVDFIDYNLEEKNRSNYYMKKILEMQSSGKKTSFNIWGLLFGCYWAFYQNMMVEGFIGWALQMLALAAAIIYNWAMPSTFITLLCLIAYGFFGNYMYMRHIERSVMQARVYDEKKKRKFYKENGGTGTKSLFCMVCCAILILFTILVSTGIVSG